MILEGKVIFKQLLFIFGYWQVKDPYANISSNILLLIFYVFILLFILFIKASFYSIIVIFIMTGLLNFYNYSLKYFTISSNISTFIQKSTYNSVYY
jgi:hypothetical protein